MSLHPGGFESTLNLSFPCPAPVTTHTRFVVIFPIVEIPCRCCGRASSTVDNPANAKRKRSGAMLGRSEAKPG